MWKSRLSKALIIAQIVWLSGCGSAPQFVAKHEPWRAQQESACLRSGAVHENRYLQARSSLGSGVCGVERPFEVAAASSGTVTLQPPALVVCDMVLAIDHWIAHVLQPTAHAYFRQPVIELKIAASYSCRPMNNQSGAKLSEHGHANAIDIAAVKLADGRWISVKDGWSIWTRDGQFLKSLHRGSCNVFTTVLGPAANSYHADHFHLDLAHHGRDGMHRVCE